MAGRKPKPTAVKKLEGNPGKRKLNTKEPNPGKGMPDTGLHLQPIVSPMPDGKRLRSTSIPRVLPMKRRMVCRDRIRGLRSVTRNSG